MYRWTEHESEIELFVEDESLEAVFAEALVAIGDLITEQRRGESVTHEIEMEAPDQATLLGRWVSELVRLAEDDGFIPERVVRMDLADAAVSATVGGQRALPVRVIRKVTYDRIEVARDGPEWRARVILDT